MVRSLRMLASVAVALGLLGSAVPPPAVAAAPRRPTPPATHAEGWVVDRVVVEPLQPSIAPLTIGGLGSYAGRLELVRTPAGVGVLNRLALDDYVAGISEVPNTWPLEALKAQAIAARTYALWDVRRAGAPATAYKAAGADICATQACQVYAGLAKTRAPNGERWAAAVEATKHELLLWKGQPIVAKYSSSNGGASVPGGQPYLRAVADPDDAHSPLHRWRLDLTYDQLRGVFGLASPATAFRRVGDRVEIDAVDPAQPGAPVQTVAMPVLDFRARANEAIAPPAGRSRTVPSVLFHVVPVDGGVVLDGRGFGHGIGLSQWGAYGKAARGMKAQDILAAYYGGIRPTAAPDGMIPETIAVAVDLDRPLAEVGAEGGGHFRLSATTAGDDGQNPQERTAVLAHAATGAWRIEPAPGGKVRVRPPVEQADPIAVEHLGTAPAEPQPDDPLVVTLRLPESALVTASAAPPAGGPPVPLGEPKLLRQGEVTIRLPPAGSAGDYAVDVATDLGGGRTNTTKVVIAVGRRGGAASTAGSGADPKTTAGDGGGHGVLGLAVSATAGGAPSLVAISLLTAVAADLGRRLRRLPGRRGLRERLRRGGFGGDAVEQLH